MVRFALVAATLLIAAASFAADVPEVPVTQPKLAAQQGFPFVAIGTTRRYIVWRDYYIYGMELTADGRPRFETRTVLVQEPGQYIQQVLAAGDRIYLVYSKDYPDPVRVRCIDTGVERVFPNLFYLRLEWNGSRLLALYTYRTGQYGVLYTPDLEPVSKEVTIESPLQYGSVMTGANGTFFRITLDKNGLAQAQTIDNDGKTTTTSSLSRLGIMSAARIATDGKDFLVVWKPTEQSIVAQHVSAKGEVTSDMLFIARVDSGRIDSPAVGWSGSDYVVAWLDSSLPSPALMIRRVSGTAVSNPIHLADPVGGASLNGGPAGLFASWWLNLSPYPGSITPAQTYAQRLDVADQPDAISYGVPTQFTSAVAADPMQTAVAWIEDKDVMRFAVRVGRFDSHGDALDGDGIEVAIPDYFTSPLDIAGNGVGYLVIWRRNQQIFGRIVGHDGRFAGDEFAISQPPRNNYSYISDAAVAWTGSQFLVTWDGPQWGAAYVTPGGTVTPYFYVTGDGAPGAARYSGGPRRLLVNARSVDKVATFVSGEFLDDGTIFDVAREPLVNGATQVLLGNVRVASNGRDYLVTWTRSRQSDAFSEAWMARVDATGKLIGAPLLAARVQHDVATAQAIPVFDGNDYRLFVHGDGMQLAMAIVNDATFACRCLTTTDLPLGPGLTFGTIAAATGGRGQVAISYTRVAVDPFLAARTRAFLRLFGYPLPRHRAAGR